MRSFMKVHSGKKLLAAVLIAVLILSAGIFGVFAATRSATGSVDNTLSVDTEGAVTVTADHKVQVGDIDYTVFVRAEIVATWQNEAGNILAAAPVKDTDYSLTINSSKWFTTSDGYYYYADPLASGESTTPLITACEPLTAAPKDGYTLSVKLAAQSIQAAGTTDEGNIPAPEDAWGTVTVSDGKLIAK